MIKYLSSALLAILLCSLTVGCNNGSGDLQEVDDPPQPYAYYFNELCDDGKNYIKINSFEINTSYSYEAVNGCFVIFGADTDLTTEKLTDTNNQAELVLGSYETVKLSFVEWNESEKKLVYKLTESENIDFEELYNLKANESVKMEVPPWAEICFGCYKNDNFMIEGENYRGRKFIVPLGNV